MPTEEIDSGLLQSALSKVTPEPCTKADSALHEENYLKPMVDVMSGSGERASEPSSCYQQHDAFIGQLARHVHNFASEVFLLLMTGVITLEVILRYLFNSGLAWSQELCGLAFFVLVFLCQPNTWQEDRHIRMDIFYNNFGKGWKAFSNLLTILCGLIFYGVMCWEGIIELQYQFQVGEGTVELEWPLWPFSLVMAFSCAILVFLLVRFAVISITRRRGGHSWNR